MSLLTPTLVGPEAGLAGGMLGQAASRVNSYAGNSKSKEPGGKLWGLARTPCSGPGSQKSGAERQEQEIRGHMGRDRAGAQEDGWRLASQAGKELRALYTPFHDFLSFNFIFTLSPHSVRLAGNSVLVLPGASSCTQGHANILVC